MSGPENGWTGAEARNLRRPAGRALLHRSMRRLFHGLKA